MVTMRRWVRLLLAVGALAAALALLAACELFGCRYGSDAASLLRAGVFLLFVLAALFAVQAVSGLTLYGLLAAWRGAARAVRFVLAIAFFAALVVLGSILELVFESYGIGAPRKRPGLSAMEWAVSVNDGGAELAVNIAPGTGQGR